MSPSKARSPRKKRLISRSPQPPPTGLANLGNSCYLNAVVQALAHCGPFAKCVCDLVDDSSAADGSADAEARLARALTGCLGALLPRPPAGRSSGAPVRPAALLSAIQERTPGFGGYRQQDAHELLRSLLDGLHQHLQQRHASATPPGQQQAPERMVIDECVLTDEAASGALVQASSPPGDGSGGSTAIAAAVDAAADAAAAPDAAAEPVIVSLDSEATGIDLLDAPTGGAGAHEASRPSSSPSRPTTAPSRPGTAAPLPTRQPVTSAVQDMFEGALVSTVRCLRCGRTSHVLEPCMDLSLPLPDEAAMADASLRACLDSYFAPEELRGGDQYACERCRSKQDCTKSLRLLHPPQLLVVHLLRFRGGHGSGPAKCSDRLPFDTDALDLSPYVCEGVGDGAQQPATYDLRALIQHHGATATSGHYTACVRRDSGGAARTTLAARAAQWYHADDGRVQPVDEATVAQSQAYLLFFERRPADTSGAGNSPRPQPQHASPASSAASSPRDAAWGAAWVATDSLADERAGAPRQRGLQQLRARWRNGSSPAPRPLTPPSATAAAADGSSSVAALAQRARRLRLAKRHASPSPVQPAVELCVSDDDTACSSLLVRPDPRPPGMRPVSADAPTRAATPEALGHASHASHASHESHESNADATPPSSAAAAASQQAARAARWRSVRATRPRSASPNRQRRHGARQAREARDAWMVYQTPRLGLRRPWHKHTKIHTWPLAEPSPSPTKTSKSKARISFSQTR